jgi:rhamnose transport system substrate-binding protein
VPLLQSEVQKKPDAIVLAGNDPNAVAPVLKQAMQQGINVVAQDSDVAPDARQIFINQATTESIGETLVDMAYEQSGGKGEIAVLSATANAPNQNSWIKVMKEKLAEPKYKDLKLVKVAYGDDDDQKSFQEMQGLLSAYPNLKVVVAPTTVGIAAGARYLSTSPKKGKVALTGLGTPNQMRKFVKDGTVTEFALWNPKDVGYLGGYAAAALASGKVTGEEGQSFEAGHLGKKTIGPNGEIVLGPPTRFNKDNIDDFDF